MATPHAAAPQLGRFIGPYSIFAPTGWNSSDDVYRALDTRDHHPVLVTVMPAHPQRREMLLRDAPAAASFAHPHAAALLEIAEDDRQESLYLVSEEVSGNPLNTVLAGRSYSPRRSIALVIQLAEAVADAHAAGLAHGDLKPEDIIVTPRGDGRILYMGLGTARAIGRPRQADGYGPLQRIPGESGDVRGDVFSLGAILFEMLTGNLPSSGTVAPGAPGQALGDVQLPALAGRVAADLRTTIAYALGRSPDSPCGSAAAFAAELRALAAIMDLPRSPLERSGRPARTDRQLVSVIDGGFAFESR